MKNQPRRHDRLCVYWLEIPGLFWQRLHGLKPTIWRCSLAAFRSAKHPRHFFKTNPTATMKTVVALALLAFVAMPSHAAKPCEELKTEIAAKLKAANVQKYSLEVVASDKVGGAKVVGSCEAGKKKITYARK
jgi:hypothetical protein